MRRHRALGAHVDVRCDPETGGGDCAHILGLRHDLGSDGASRDLGRSFKALSKLLYSCKRMAKILGDAVSWLG